MKPWKRQNVSFGRGEARQRKFYDFSLKGEKIPKKSKIHEFQNIKIEITRIKSVFSFGSVFFGQAKKMNTIINYKIIELEFDEK